MTLGAISHILQHGGLHHVNCRMKTVSELRLLWSTFRRVLQEYLCPFRGQGEIQVANEEANLQT
jgi:hypothetical protein